MILRCPACCQDVKTVVFHYRVARKMECYCKGADFKDFERWSPELIVDTTEEIIRNEHVPWICLSGMVDAWGKEILEVESLYIVATINPVSSWTKTIRARPHPQTETGWRYQGIYTDSGVLYGLERYNAYARWLHGFGFDPLYVRWEKLKS